MGSNRGRDNSVIEVMFIWWFREALFSFSAESEAVEGMGSQGLTTVDGPGDSCL